VSSTIKRVLLLLVFGACWVDFALHPYGIGTADRLYPKGAWVLFSPTSHLRQAIDVYIMLGCFLLLIVLESVKRESDQSTKKAK
jgi:hypothetical protein